MFYLLAGLVSLCYTAISASIYYYFLKDISGKCALIYGVIGIATTILGFISFLFIFRPIADRSLVTFIPSIVWIGTISIILEFLIMHFVFKYSYKKVALPVVINNVIRYGLILM